MEAAKRQGPLGYAIGFAAVAAALLFESVDLWKEHRFFALLAIVGAVACVIAALYNLLAAGSHQGTRLDIQESAWPGGKLVAILRAPGLRGARQLSATFACMEVVDKGYQFSTDDRRYQEELVWSEQGTFPVISRQGRSECRIEFEVPDLRPSSAEVLWQITVQARGSGMELKRRFLVPIVPRPAANPAGTMRG